MTKDRSIEVEIEVPGTPEEVWRAVATGPGISSWYVPHTLQERSGGDMTVSFSPEEWGQVRGRVAAWDPPHRVVFDGGQGVEGFVFEWTVSDRGNGTCLVHLANSGFGSGADWDAQYDGMSKGWVMFLSNLKAHLENFSGQSATPALATATWELERGEAWKRLLANLELNPDLSIGDRVEIAPDGAPALAGRVADRTDSRLTIVLDSPAPGTALVAAEGQGESSEVSVWAYLYGDEGSALTNGHYQQWSSWLTSTAP